MLEVLKIPKRTYYKYRNTEDPDFGEYLLIKDVFDKSKGIYGYRRICECLKIDYGVIINHKKILRIMKKYNIKPEYIKRLKPNYSRKRQEEYVKPDLVKRSFNPNKENKIWCTDITYLIFGNKRLYLSTIIDLFDRKVVSYKISKFNDLFVVINTLNEAFAKRKDVQGLIIHSDQGFQYTSQQYNTICTSKGVMISMSRKGTPIDDSPMESFHGILKKETLYNNEVKSIDHYKSLVEEWILFYNSTRLKNKRKQL